MASRKTLVHETLTDSIDDQIAELRNRKAEMNRAADALVSADTAVADARLALKRAEETLAQRRAEIVALGVKPREISRILKQMRGEAAGDSNTTGQDDRALEHVAGGEDLSVPPATI